MHIRDKLRGIMRKVKEKQGVDLFAQLLRRRRRHLEMTIEELEDLSGVSKSTIQRVEKAQQHPPLIIIFKLCKALEVQPGEYINMAWESWNEHGE